MKGTFVHSYIISIVLFLLASSCTSTKTILIEIPQPSKKELPVQIQSLLLVNRTVDSKYTDLKSDSLQVLFYKENFNYDTVIYDITAADTALKVLGDLLFETGRYDIVIPEDRFLKFEKNAFFSKEMPWQQVKELCEKYQTDAILSTDMFVTRVATDFDKDTYFDPYNNGFFTSSSAQMKIFYDALFRVYDPLAEKVLVREFFKDTLLWEGNHIDTRELFKDFTPVKQGLSEAGIALALDFTDKIGTIWRTEQRVLFIRGDKEIKQAGTFIDNGEWPAAKALWKESANNTKSKAVKSKAEFNIAVASELEGDIDQAIFWGLKSYETMFRQITYQYLELLRKRKIELEKQKQ